MFCDGCGTELGMTARFCRECGSPTPYNASTMEEIKDALLALNLLMSSGNIPKKYKKPLQDAMNIICDFNEVFAKKTSILYNPEDVLPYPKKTIEDAFYFCLEILPQLKLSNTHKSALKNQFEVCLVFLEDYTNDPEKLRFSEEMDEMMENHSEKEEPGVSSVRTVSEKKETFTTQRRRWPVLIHSFVSAARLSLIPTVIIGILAVCATRLITNWFEATIISVIIFAGMWLVIVLHVTAEVLRDWLVEINGENWLRKNIGWLIFVFITIGILSFLTSEFNVNSPSAHFKVFSFYVGIGGVVLLIYHFSYLSRYSWKPLFPLFLLFFSLVSLYVRIYPLFKAPAPVAPAIPNKSSTHVPLTQKQSSAPNPANKSYSITGLRESLSLTNEEEKFLRKWNYIKAYLDSSDKTEYEDMLERIKNILEKLRCRKEVVEGILIREGHGANGGGFDIKTRAGDIRSFYWSGSWGHPTLIMKGSFIPLELKIGEKIKIYFCEKTTALGIFK